MPHWVYGMIQDGVITVIKCEKRINHFLLVLERIIEKHIIDNY